ncbi:NAD(P)-dependent glycerol-3-phosphate dehydrogenase [bacterium]|nr:NAD(P)-dependent glycerol-3-phosphate dehydrogenase [bacterium]
MENNRFRISVIGAGGWGTTIANIVAENGHDVQLWVYDDETLENLRTKRENTIFLPGVKINERVSFCKNIFELKKSDLVFLVTPSKFYRKIIKDCIDHFGEVPEYVSFTKGFDSKSNCVMTDIIREFTGDNVKIAAVSGPNLAREISQKIPSATVVASNSIELSTKVQDVLTRPYFRVYTSDDEYGVQIGGALKNIIAIASGISDGLGFGSNSRATLLTRGLAEITRFGNYFHSKFETFFGLSGMGDMMATATSELSRNYSFGYKLGQGENPDEIVKDMKMVVEGIDTVKAVWGFAKKQKLDLPIINEIYGIIYSGRKVEDAVRNLMSREKKEEFYFLKK